MKEIDDSGQTWVPTAQAITAACAGPYDVASVPAKSVLEVVQRLAENHDRQWDEEDECRDPATTTEMFAMLKHRIDGRNSDRTGFIQEIDRIVERWSGSGPEDVVLHTETLGCVVDRIVIARIRAMKLGRGDGVNELRAESAGRQFAELQLAYDALRDEVRHGRRRFPTWLPLKAYGESSRT